MDTGNDIPPTFSGLDSVATIVLAGGKGTRLHELTIHESKPALYFAGAQRIIDFAMANVVRSGITRTIVATQYQPKTLHHYLPSRWGQSFAARDLILKDGHGSYRGTADALRRNWSLIERSECRDVLVLAADHVYEMDYRPLIMSHRRSGAEVTIGVNMTPMAAASAFGVVDARPDGLITSFLEKPADPPAARDNPGFSLVSMGIYIFSKSWIENALFGDDTAVDFGQHIVPLAVEERRANAFPLASATACKTYWQDVGTLDAFRRSQLDFADTPPCRLPGAPPQVQWRLGADSVLMPGASVARGVRLNRTIVAPGAHLPPGLVVGEDPEEDRRWFRVTREGTILITQQMLLRRAGVRCHGDLMRQFGGSRLPSGSLGGAWN